MVHAVTHRTCGIDVIYLFYTIDEINLHIDSTQRELKKVVSGKQNLMVDENIIKLEVKRLRDILFAHSDEVYSLEKRKLQLNTVCTADILTIVVS